MSETLNEDQIGKVVKYIQKKERLISALNSAVRTAEAPIYAEALNELIILLIEDKLLPDSFNTHKFFPDLYPRATQKKEAKDENTDVQ
jgi:hypothetical protein